MVTINKNRGKGKTHDCVLACIVTNSIYVGFTSQECDRAKEIAKTEYGKEIEAITVDDYIYRNVRSDYFGRTFVIDELDLCMNKIFRGGVIMNTITLNK